MTSIKINEQKRSDSDDLRTSILAQIKNVIGGIPCHFLRMLCKNWIKIPNWSVKFQHIKWIKGPSLAELSHVLEGCCESEWWFYNWSNTASLWCAKPTQRRQQAHTALHVHTHAYLWTNLLNPSSAQVCLSVGFDTKRSIPSFTGVLPCNIKGIYSVECW